MVGRYLKAQAAVLLFGGLVGPIFLIVYFALGAMARPYLQWMFWVGLFVTAADILVALWLANAGAKAQVRHRELTRTGVVVLAPITGVSDTAVFINDQQMIKVALRIEVPGFPGFTAEQTMPSSPARMRILNAHKLVVLVEPGTENYEIDWDASALVAGVVPAEFTVEADHRTYDLTGQDGPLTDSIRRAGNPRGAEPAAPAEPPPATASQRLGELETLRAAGAVTDAEYNDKRRQIINDL